MAEAEADSPIPESNENEDKMSTSSENFMRTASVGGEHQKLKRAEIKTQADSLLEIIENCSVFNRALLLELSPGKLTYVALESAKSQLEQSEINLVQAHEKWRCMLGDIEPDLKIRNQVDQLLADHEQVMNQVLHQMSTLSVKNKTTVPNELHQPATATNQHDRPATATDQSDEALMLPSTTRPTSHPSHSVIHSLTSHQRSHRSGSYRSGSYRSGSHRSGSSRASSSIKLMQLQAKANVAVMQKRLVSTRQTQELERQAQELTQAIEQQKIQTEIDVAKVEEQILSQALEEEEIGSLLHSPSIKSQLVPPDHPPSVSSVHDHVQKYIQQQHPIPNESANHDTYLVAPQLIQPTPLNSYQKSTPAQGFIPASPVTISSVTSDQQAFADTLAKAIHSVKLKPAEPAIFYGDPLTYLDWKVAFEGLIESVNHSPLQKLAFLQQYLGGKAKEAVIGFFQIGTEEAFKNAKSKLDKRFGQPHVLSEAYRSKLEQWPIIKEHDGEGLQRLADFLESCKTAMRRLPELHCLNDRRENVKILEKLPLSVGRRWVKKATQIETNTLKFPTLYDFSHFLTEESNVATSSLSMALLKRDHSNKRNETTKPIKTNNPERKATTLLTTETTNIQSNHENNRFKSKQVRYPCLHCNMDNHPTGGCSKLGAQKYDDIEKLFMNQNLCFACAKPGHKKEDCRYPQKCFKQDCGQEHLTIFHGYHTRSSDNKTSAPTRGSESKPSYQSIGSENKTFQEPANTSNDTKPGPLPSNPTATARNCTEFNDKSAKLTSWTIPVYVSTRDNPDKEILVYALLDSGSNNTFITNETLDQLNVKTTEQNINISTLTDTDGSQSTRKRAQGLLVRGYKKQKIIALPSCLSQNKIPFNRAEIPTALSVRDWSHLSGIATELISEQQSKTINFGLLIGANLPQVFISREERVGSDHEPFARLTDLGWTLMGNTSKISTHQAIVNLVVSEPINRTHISYKIQTNTPEDNDNLERKIIQTLSSDFQTTHQDEITNLSIEDIKFIKTMTEQIHKDIDGYITMPLPFKSKPASNNNSKIMAMHRFNILQKKLTNPSFSNHYYAFMNDILAQGDAELVPNNEIDNPDSWYIPHFGVYHPKKPGKIRVVFDGAAKVGGMCLNDHLMQGPDQLNSLLGILLRFRKEQVGVACDIGRMFHQFRVPPDHKDFLRFLWFDDKGQVATYRMKVHIFGATSSPACTTFGLRSLCDMSQNGNLSAKTFIKSNFYVDDGLISLSDPLSATNLLHDAIAICKEGNLRLHKFSSNSPEFLKTLPESERNLQDIQSLDPDDASQPLEKTLGLIWSIKSDHFQFSSELKENPNTRRGVLSSIASIFDPLGLLSPFILNGKNILQDMCRISASWDDPLTPNLLSRWEGWKASLSDLPQLAIPRCYKPRNFGTIKYAAVHHFSDASTSGYGCVSYLRLVNTTGQVHCSLITSKSRVAPIKPVTIPRLELQAAVTASQTSRLISNELGLDVTHTFWTDSQVVLGYLRNTSKKFHVYVTNRIQQVRDNCNPESWFYVPTSINPADHASRGMSVKQLIDSDWLTGPQFLWKEPIETPVQPTTTVSSDDPEIRSLMVVSHNSTDQQPNLYDLLHRFSSWSTAVKVTGVFIRKALSHSTKLPNHDIVSRSVSYIIRSIQQKHFPEFYCLRDRKPILRNSNIFNLCPFLDEDEIMRIGGRLNSSTSLEYVEKHPIILPKTGHFTKLLLQHLHEKTAHQGRGMTLAKMRSSGYWVINANSVVNSLIHHCVTCRLQRANTTMPQMSSLPKERSIESPPFSYCGVDCFGPFLVKDRRTELKRYGLMITCLASRAVHIELLDDMTTTAFINGIRNVIAIRGPIREIWCDQGTNFVGAIPELTDKGVLEFKLNPPSASHMGGVWERMIRTAKNVLQVLLRKHGGRLDTSGLRTLLYEVMAIVNSRPLSTVTEEEMPLCPNQLLTMKSDIVLPPPSEFTDSDIYSRKRWRSVQHLSNEFWKRWRSEYLSLLQSRQKWVSDKPDIKRGSIVLIKDDNVPRNQWLRGRVEECYKSHDGRVRSAKVLLGNRLNATNSNKYLVRPISKIITLIESEKIE